MVTDSGGESSEKKREGENNWAICPIGTLLNLLLGSDDSVLHVSPPNYRVRWCVKGCTKSQVCINDNSINSAEGRSTLVTQKVM